MITKEDFVDPLSQDIFEYRKNFYETGDWKYLLRMFIREHSAIVEKVQSIANRFYQDMEKSKMRIVVFGGGNNGTWTYHCLRRHGMKDKVVAYVDNSKEKQSNGCSGLPVHSVEWLMNEDEKYLVLIPEGPYQQEMYHQLRTAGYPEGAVYKVPGLAIWQDGMEDCEDMEDVFFHSKHHFVIFRTYWASRLIYWHMLKPSGVSVDGFCEPDVTADDMFLGLPIKTLGEWQRQDGLPYFIAMDMPSQECLEKAGIPKNRIIRLAVMTSVQYFDEEVNPYHSGNLETFIDGGVCDLGSSMLFLDWCHGNCDKIYAFEPDERCRAICQKRMDSDEELAEKVKLIPKGIWSEPKMLVFNNSFLGCSSLKDAPENEESKSDSDVVRIPCTSIDEELNGEQATFIKFDIEGSELAGLKGARKTIEKYHPTLAIAVYHKPEDIVELPSYIKKIAPGYQFYLRSYNEDATETVLYARWLQADDVTK